MFEFKYYGPTGPKNNEELVEIQDKLRAESKQCRREAIIALPIVFLCWGMFIVAMKYYWG